MYEKKIPLSRLGLYALVVSITVTVLLSIADGFVAAIPHNTDVYLMVRTWVTDFRYLGETGITAGTLVFVAAKFIEARTMISIGFDKLDSARMSLKDPDEHNIVWVGRKYDTPFEAEAVAATLTRRMEEETI